MLRALLEAGITPDLVVGTSVGAVNGVVVAAAPSPRRSSGSPRCGGSWTPAACSRGSVLGRLRTLARTRTSLHTDEPLRELLDRHLPVRTFDELAVPFQCVAASIERAAEHWFTPARWPTRCWPPAPCPDCCRRSRSAGRPSWTAAWCTASRSAARSPSAPAPCTCCRSGGSSGRSAAAATVGGRAGRVRGGPPAPLRRGHGLAAAGRDRARAAHRAAGAGADLRSQLRYRDSAGIGDRIDSAYAATAAYLAAERR